MLKFFKLSQQILDDYNYFQMDTLISKITVMVLYFKWDYLDSRDPCLYIQILLEDMLLLNIPLIVMPLYFFISFMFFLNQMEQISC